MSAVKRVKLKLQRPEQLKIVLEDLENNIHDGIEIILRVEENKETLSYLCHSVEIQDWDFIEEAVKDEPKIITAKEEDNILQKLEIKDKDYNSIAWIIEAVYMLAHKSPALLYGSDFFYSALKKLLEETKTISPEHTILTMLGETRYRNWDWNDAGEDLDRILKNLWTTGEIKLDTLTKFAKKIYG